LNVSDDIVLSWFVEFSNLMTLGEWDAVQIMNTPGFYDFDRNEAYVFCKENGINLSIIDQFYFSIFAVYP
ncbi:MAG: hypothetical protein RSD76_04765, partial [Clostridia bacterium]